MSFDDARLRRTYDFRALIGVYISTQSKNFVHSDFKTYYVSLLEALQRLFGIRLSSEDLSFDQQVFWSLFENTVRSLLQITNPWSGYLEAGMINKKLKESGELGRIVLSGIAVIRKANGESAAAHYEILYALFQAIFGECKRIVTSEELLASGFDDTKKPDIANYYDYM